MTYRSDVDALKTRHDALDAEVSRQTSERDQTLAALDAARAKARLPIFDNLKVAAPCHAPWDKMTGDARVRHCGDCNKNVYNLSNMTRAEAEAVIVTHEGKLCVRYYQRKDGTILFADCAVGVKQRRRRRLIVAAGATLVAAGAATAALFVAHKTKPDEVVMGRYETPMMGQLEVTTPPPSPAPSNITPPPDTLVRQGDVSVPHFASQPPPAPPPHAPPIPAPPK